MTWLRRGFVLAVVLVAAFSNPARAIDVAPNQFEQKLKSFDPAAVEAARTYARTFDFKGTMEKAIPALRQSMAAQLKSKNQSLTDAQVTEFFDAFLRSAFVDDAVVLEHASVLLMLEVLSKEELIALNGFYGTPVGRGILAKMPVLMGRMPELMNLMQTYVIPRAIQVARDKLKKQGVDVRI